MMLLDDFLQLWESELMGFWQTALDLHHFSAVFLSLSEHHQFYTPVVMMAAVSKERC